MILSPACKELFPAFSLTLTGLPEWLKRDDHYGFTVSTGILHLTGTPPKNGPAKITITAANAFGAAQPTILSITVADKGKGIQAAP